MMTGSVALLSDALESIVNVVTAITTLIAVYIAASRPAPPCPMAMTSGIFLRRHRRRVHPRCRAADLPAGLAALCRCDPTRYLDGRSAGQRHRRRGQRAVVPGAVPTRPQDAFAGPCRGRQTPFDRRRVLGGCSHRRFRRRCFRLVDSRPAARHDRRRQHSVVGLQAGLGKRRRADGRGGTRRTAQPHPRHHLGQCRRRHRSA